MKINYEKYCYKIDSNYGLHYNNSYYNVGGDGKVSQCKIIIVDDGYGIIKPFSFTFEISEPTFCRVGNDACEAQWETLNKIDDKIKL